MTNSINTAIIAAVKSTDDNDDLRRALVDLGIGNHRMTNFACTYTKNTGSIRAQVPSDYYYAVVGVAESIGMIISKDARPDSSWSWAAKWRITAKALRNQARASQCLGNAIAFIRDNA